MVYSVEIPIAMLLRTHDVFHTMIISTLLRSLNEAIFKWFVSVGRK